MDIAQPTKPISDDQELAEALAGVTSDAPASTAPLQFEPTTSPDDAAPVAAADAAEVENDVANLQMPDEDDATDELPTTFTPPAPLTDSSVVDTVSVAPSSDSELDAIKKTALEELRPLVDKLNIPADEKFDTLLLLIRSTDDKALIEPAHVAAQAITDESRRAQALLEIIKEIDYLSRQNQ